MEACPTADNSLLEIVPWSPVIPLRRPGSALTLSFAHQRWTAEVRSRKKERRRREENASDSQEMLLDPRDDDLIDDTLDQLDDEPTLSTMD
jgi:hypothetical protein